MGAGVIPQSMLHPSQCYGDRVLGRNKCYFFTLQKMEPDSLWLKGPLILPAGLPSTEVELKSSERKRWAQVYTGRPWNCYVLLAFLLQKNYFKNPRLLHLYKDI